MVMKKSLDHCYYCPNLCRESCPVSDADQDEMSTPRAKMMTMKLLADRKLEWSHEAALQAYKCADCGMSTQTCELDNPVSSVLIQFRAKAYKKGFSPQSVYDFCARFKHRNNPYGVRLLELLKKKFPKDLFRPAAVTYFPGCSEIHHHPQTVQHTMELFGKLGLESFGLFDQAIQCCGYPLLAAGDLNGFKEHAEVLSHMFDDYPLVVCGDPVCVYTLDKLFPIYGFPVKAQIVSLPQFLDSQMKQSNFHVRKSVQTKVAYHDPCFLGRYLNVYEEPRRVLKTVIGTDPIEFRRKREGSYCCGGGGLLPVTRPETAQKMTESRLAEFQETDAKVLVSSCSTCVNRFREFGGSMQVQNLVDFLNSAIRPEGPGKIIDEFGEK